MSGSILVIRFGSLGDIVLSSAAVLNLKLSFPDKSLVYLTRAQYGSLVTGFDGVDHIRTIPDDAGPTDLRRALSSLNITAFDLIVDLHGNWRSWLTRQLVRGERTAVYPKRRLERYRAVRRRRKKLPDDWPHTIDLYNTAVEAAGGRIYCRRPILRSEQPAAPDAPLRVLIAPGARHPNKQWPSERFVELARRLCERHACHIVWAVASGDGVSVAPDKEMPAEALTVLGDSSTLDLTAALAGCQLAVTNDSGVMHLASAVGTPVIALFGPTHPVLGFAPRGRLDRVIEVAESCRPCSLHGRTPCFRQERYCFTRIDPDHVEAAAAELLAVTRRLHPALLVDRDGTVMVDRDFCSDPEEVQLLPGAAKALLIARAKGFRIVVLSNQSGVARGYFTTDDVDRVNGRLLELLAAEGVEVDGVYYCPYYEEGTVPEYTLASDWRKPSPGMAERAAADLDLDLHRSVVIGDKVSDVNLGRVIGGRSFLVRTGHGGSEAVAMKETSLGDKHPVFENLLAAVEHLKD
jgi:histidinol-phosphate phosphatase family protein